jgi:hypothetical protein
MMIIKSHAVLLDSSNINGGSAIKNGKKYEKYD